MAHVGGKPCRFDGSISARVNVRWHLGDRPPLPCPLIGIGDGGRRGQMGADGGRWGRTGEDGEDGEDRGDRGGDGCAAISTGVPGPLRRGL